jgi:hypothetical protein
MERIVWEKEPSPLHSSETVNTTPIDDTAAAEFDDHDVSQIQSEQSLWHEQRHRQSHNQIRRQTDRQTH